MPFRNGRSLVLVDLKSGRDIGSSVQHSQQHSLTQSKRSAKGSKGGLQVFIVTFSSNEIDKTCNQ